MSVSVVYWSGTGNTQTMAEAVAEGIRMAGQEPAVLEVSAADPANLFHFRFNHNGFHFKPSSITICNFYLSNYG